MNQKSKVMVIDDVLYGIMQQAAKEGLLVTDEKQLDYYRSMPLDHAMNQRALALLVLYDEILIPTMMEENAPKIEKLEQEGVIQRVPETLDGVSKMCSTGWGLHRNFRWLGKYLSDHANIRPLIVDRLMAMEDTMPEENQFFRPMARDVGIRRDQFFDALIRYAAALMTNDHLELQSNALNLCLEPGFLAAIREEILGRNRPLRDHSLMDFVLLGAVVQIDTIKLATEAPAKYGATLATRHFGASLFGGKKHDDAALESADTFHLVRYAMFNQHNCSSAIESMGHALLLRKDPNVKSFKEQIHRYRSLVLAGEIVDATQVEKDVLRAHELLEENARAKIAWDWSTYVGMGSPALAILLASNPAMLTLLAVTSAVISTASGVGTKTGNQTFKANSWVLLGR